MIEIWNWAKTFHCRPKYYFEPSSIESLKEIINEVNKNQWKVRVIGCGHSPSSLSMSNQVLISMKHWNKIIDIDKTKEEVHCQSAVLLSSLNEILVKYNLSLPVQGSVSGITLAGAVSTATHGSGIQFGSISSYVLSITLMKLDGNIEEYHFDDDDKQRLEIFRCLTCSLGTFGILLSIKLKLSKSFDLELNRNRLEFKDFLNNFNLYLHSSDHFRYMWYPHTDYGIAFHLKRIEPNENLRKKHRQIPIISKIFSWFRNRFLGYHLLELLFYLSLSMPRLVQWINKVYLKLDSKKVHQIDRCDRLFNFDCLFRQFASEWAIPIDETVSCLVDIEQLIEKHGHVHFPIEIRFNNQEENSYLSPCYQRKTCWINIVSYRPYGINHFVHRPFFREFERICQKYQGRPHWAKEHPLNKEDLSKVYPQWNLFERNRKMFDPNDLLINECLSNVFT